MKRLRVGIIFGGRSVEHEVSLVSARSILAAIDPDRYEIVPIGVTRTGMWLTSREGVRFLEEGLSGTSGEHAALLADPSVSGLVTIDREAGSASSLGSLAPLDVVFPLIHGGGGEDGKLQGLLELADVAYVGSGVLGSAVGMDKEVAKRLFHAAGLPVVDFVVLRAHEWAEEGETADVGISPALRAPAAVRGTAGAPAREPAARATAERGAGPIQAPRAGGRRFARARIEEDLGYPCFVKPAGLGSSVGVSRARHWDEACVAIEEAFSFDEKVLVERAIDAREVEVAVLGNERPEASVTGEILTDREFYDYDAKYHDDQTRLLIPAPLPEEVSENVRGIALDAFRTLELAGMARVDFFLDRKTLQPYLNEVNTLPGFTPVSMYPKLWQASGLSYSSLVDRLIELALERRDARRRLRTNRNGAGAKPDRKGDDRA